LVAKSRQLTHRSMVISGGPRQCCTRWKMLCSPSSALSAQYKWHSSQLWEPLDLELQDDLSEFPSNYNYSKKFLFYPLQRQQGHTASHVMRHSRYLQIKPRGLLSTKSRRTYLSTEKSATSIRLQQSFGQEFSFELTNSCKPFLLSLCNDNLWSRNGNRQSVMIQITSPSMRDEAERGHAKQMLRDDSDRGHAMGSNVA